MRSILYSSAIFSIALLCTSASADEPTEKDAIALVEKGAALIKSQGKDEMIKRINAKDPAFVQTYLYIHISELKTGIILAHPFNPALVGKDLTDVPDTSGKKFRRVAMELAGKQGSGWVDYTYKNPATGKVEPKSTYIMRVDDVVLQAGIYKK